MSVTVIIPVYNAEEYIARAINSCLKQREVTEIIVVNDGSTDSSDEIIRYIKKTNPIIKILYHIDNKNMGPAVSRNLGLTKATQTYVTFLDADDYYLKNRFTRSYKLLENKDIDGVYCVAENVGVNSDNYPRFIGHRPVSASLFSEILNGSLSIALWSILYRREKALELPKFISELVPAEDLQFVFLSITRLKIVFCGVDNPLIIRNLHEHNISKVAPQDTHIKCRRKIFTYWFNQLEKEAFTKEEKHHITKHYSSYVLQDAFPRLYHTPLLGRLFLRLFYVYNRLA